jgi:PKD repeat protein
MRLSWFSRSRTQRSRRVRRRRHDPRLRVRQLERRRVLDAAIGSLMVTPTVPVEGQNVSASATATGTGPLVFDWSVTEDGIEIDSGTNSGVNPNDPVTFNFTLPDDTEQMEHEYQLHLTVTDADTTTASATVNFDVTNAAPVLVVAPNQSVNEGQTLNLSGSGVALPLGLFADAGVNDTHTATVDWGDGSGAQSATVSFFNGTGVLGATHAYADNDVYTVTVSVSDGDGGSDTDSFQVTVNNVPPVLVVAQDQMVNEGQLLDLSGSGMASPLGLFVDAGVNDTHTGTVDWGDGSGPQSATVVSVNGAGTLGSTHTYLENGTYTVTVVVMDDGGGSDTDTFQVVVNNVDPTVALNPVAMINENGLATLTGSFTDIGLLDAHTLTIGWNDDNDSQPSTFDITAIYDAAGTQTLFADDTFSSTTDEAVLKITSVNTVTGQVGFAVQHQYLDDGLAPGNATTQDTSTITVKVDDDDADSGTDSESVLVKNVAPVLVVVPDQMVNEGQLLNLSGSGGSPLALFVDAGTLDIHTATIDWGDGSLLDNAAVTFLSGAGSLGGSHTYADDGVYTVTVTLQDDDGGMDQETFTVTVKNVPPVLLLVGNQVVDEGSILDLSGTSGPPLGLFVDVGILDTHTAIVDWGDGLAPQNAAVVFSNGSGSLGGSHIYADNGTYTVTVRLADDDMSGNFATGINGIDFVEKTFTVTVNNVQPFLTGIANLSVSEGDAFTLDSLGVGLQDPGFDNPNNVNDPANGGQVAETLSAMTIDWGDGSTPQVLSLLEMQAGPLMGPTTATFPAIGHTYADNGNYTVKVTVKDDDMTSFATLTLTIVVNNVDPELALFDAMSIPPISMPQQTEIFESNSVSFSAAFTDPGFDNPNNTLDPSNGGEVAETFSYEIDWGDGHITAAAVPPMDVTSGSPGVLTQGGFGGNHVYADDGTYTVTVKVFDDDGGVGTQTFTVIVKNENPQFVSSDPMLPFQGDDVSSQGITVIRGAFDDVGFDNPDNQNAPLPGEIHITDINHESFSYIINWSDSVDAIHNYLDPQTGVVTVMVSGPGFSGPIDVSGFVGNSNSVLNLVSDQDPGAAAQPYDFVIDWGNGTVQRFTLMLKAPIFPGQPGAVSTGETTVNSTLRDSGSPGVPTEGSFEIMHRYFAPPDPNNASAPIEITTMIVDDNNGFVAGSITVENPGIDVVNVAIDTTPEIPRLDVATLPVTEAFVDSQSTFNQGLQEASARVVTSELLVSSERYLELEVVAPDGTVISRHRIRDEALNDLRAFFATLPDNHYRIYLVRTDNNSRRLIMEVYVRRGRVIDPSDDSEGTRDRPPTSEELQHTAPPLEQNPQLQPVPENPDNAAPVDDGSNADSQSDANTPIKDDLADSDRAEPGCQPLDSAAPSPGPQPLVPLRGSYRWVVPLAAFSLVANRDSWSQRVTTALENADERDWQRLRRAGRLAGHRNPRRIPDDGMYNRT